MSEYNPLGHSEFMAIQQFKEDLRACYEEAIKTGKYDANTLRYVIDTLDLHYILVELEREKEITKEYNNNTNKEGKGVDKCEAN